MTGGSFVFDRSLGQSHGRPLFVPEEEFRRWRAAPEEPGEKVAERPQETRDRSSGGRPKRTDWKLIDQQTVREVALGKGNLTRTELRKRMKAFADENMTEPPDDRTIERHLDDLVPDDVLAKD
jgi:hypothetical protein